MPGHAMMLDKDMSSAYHLATQDKHQQSG